MKNAVIWGYKRESRRGRCPSRCPKNTPPGEKCAVADSKPPTSARTGALLLSFSAVKAIAEAVDSDDFIGDFRQLHPQATDMDVDSAAAAIIIGAPDEI